MTTAIRVKFIAPGVIRIYKKDAAGNPVGLGVTIKTAIDFCADFQRGMQALIARVETVILANMRIVKWLKGGRLK